jgi:hypothetical protein
MRHMCCSCSSRPCSCMHESELLGACCVLPQVAWEKRMASKASRQAFLDNKKAAVDAAKEKRKVGAESAGGGGGGGGGGVGARWGPGGGGGRKWARGVPLWVSWQQSWCWWDVSVVGCSGGTCSASA